MAESSPAWAHSWRYTELRTWRAAGFRPKLMLDRPRVVWTPGSSALMSSDALDGRGAVAATLLHAGAEGECERVEDEVGRLEPVAVDGQVVDGRGRPCSFHSGVRAWPSSSMQVQTTAAPYSRAMVRKRSRRVPGASPSSRLTELRIGRPPTHWRAASITGGSVESIMSGASAWVANRLAISSMSWAPSRPT